MFENGIETVVFKILIYLYLKLFFIFLDYFIVLISKIIF